MSDKHHFASTKLLHFLLNIGVNLPNFLIILLPKFQHVLPTTLCVYVTGFMKRNRLCTIFRNTFLKYLIHYMYLKKFCGQMASIQAVLSSTCYIAKSIPSLTSQSCGSILPAVCLFVGDTLASCLFVCLEDEAIYRPPEQSQMSNKLKKEASVKAEYLTFGYSTHMNC